MPVGMLSSLVFVGENFSAAMFDERALFADFGALDHDQMKIGPAAQFSYADGQYRFVVRPDRIDIQSHELTIIPQSLIAVASQVMSVLEPARKAIPVSGIGINCDAIFEQQDLGRTGIEFCDSLTLNQTSKALIGVESLTASASFRFRGERVHYAVRIEPESRSQGQNLLVAVNGHQRVAPQDQLADMLEAVPEVRNYVAALYQRVTKRSEGE